MPKVRVHQLAKELNLTNDKIIEHLTKRGVTVKNHFQAVDESTAESIRRAVLREDERVKARKAGKSAPKAETKPAAKKSAAKSKAKESPTEPEVSPVESELESEAEAETEAETEVETEVEAEETVAPILGVVELPEGATVKEFAEAIGREPNDIIKVLIKMGEMLTINQVISDTARGLLADELGIEVEVVSSGVESAEEYVDDESQLVVRPPVVTIMGHVDHGKTSLLEAVRETDIISGEAGGITQHIGAYTVQHGDKRITVIDTPGHEAFTAMRARGASVTDIAILVVAADDGVMPQTVEAIEHAKAANVPLLVAINKIDKPGADPEKIKQSLTEYELVPEEWGGDTVFVEVSAKMKTNINDMLDMILLTAEMRELKANPFAAARGVVVEAKLDRGRGPVATVLVQRGTLTPGDPVVIGASYGKVRALFDDHGERIEKAGPGVPVEILGLSSVPSAGESFKVVVDEREARSIAEERALKRRQVAQMRPHVTLDDLFERLQEGEVQELKIVLKGDVQGSVEALQESLEKLDHEEVKIVVIRKAVGAISESDVMLAAASDAIIIGFNVRPEAKAKAMAEKEHVDVRTYRVIYQVVDDIKSALVGMLKPEFKEVDVGRVEVREVFKVPKLGFIAGCYVSEGEIERGSLVRLVRDGVVVYEGTITSLRRFKDDVKQVKSGYECGIGLENFTDVKAGDIVEAYKKVEVPREY